MREKLDYIHANPVKRGYVNLPEHWRYSSAANYAGLAGLIDITTSKPKIMMRLKRFSASWHKRTTTKSLPVPMPCRGVVIDAPI